MMQLSFSERWRQYTLLAVALGSLRESSAQVIYTDIDPDFLVSGPIEGSFYDALQLDFNADGSPEGSFIFSRFTFNGSCYTAGSMSFALLNSASVLLDSVGYIMPLAEGSSIGAAANWNSSFFQSFFRSDFFIDTCDGDLEYPVLAGPWQTENNSFLGMRFVDAAGDLHYGWVRLSVKVEPAEGAALLNVIRIGDYAYEATPDMTIVAGDQGPSVNLNEQGSASSWEIGPNPAAEILYLHGGADKSIDRYIIFNQIGSLVEEQVLAQSTIDITMLPRGMYYLQLQQNEQIVQVLPFIKR